MFCRHFERNATSMTPCYFVGDEKSRKENSQELIQFNARSHSSHPVGKDSI